MHAEQTEHDSDRVNGPKLNHKIEPLPTEEWRKATKSIRSNIVVSSSYLIDSGSVQVQIQQIPVLSSIVVVVVVPHSEGTEGAARRVALILAAVPAQVEDEPCHPLDLLRVLLHVVVQARLQTPGVLLRRINRLIVDCHFGCGI